MDTPEMIKPQPTTVRKRKGQTLAEFAITLPILLILVFGVIEFGRIFQAWVTLQNSVRTAARYASTGAYDRSLFPLDDSGLNDPDSVVPCIVGDFRGTRATVDPNNDGRLINIFQGGEESLFATWWDGRDCDPRIVDHQDMRKDIVRILSIVNEARRGAAGLAIGPSPIDPIRNEEDVRAFLYDVWYRPLPGNGAYQHRRGYNQAGWFDVLVCSSRQMLNDFSQPNYARQYASSRYAGVLDEDAGIISGVSPVDAARAPVCLLNEIPPPDTGGLVNPGIPWLDPGTAGDSVTIVVTFNHPLITPLGLAEYIPLQARRVAVNEAFRVADATRALTGGGRIGPINRPPVARPCCTVTLTDTAGVGYIDFTMYDDGSYDPDEPEDFIVSYEWLDEGGNLRGTGQSLTLRLTAPGEYVFVLRVTDTYGAQGEASIRVTLQGPIPTDPPPPTDAPPTATHTPEPFTCDRLTAGELSFSGSRVYIQFRNTNVDSTELTRARLNWRLVPQFPTMHVYAFALDQIIHWAGQDYTPPTDTMADPPVPADLFINADRTVPGNSVMTWEAVFAGGINVLSNYMTVYDFGGTIFTFRNPNGGFCDIPLDLPEPTPVPTFDPDQPTVTPSFTPDCASDQISVTFVDFQPFGVVRLNVTNRRPVVGVMSDFRIAWRQRAPGIMTLERVTVGGSGPADNITPSIRVWESGSASEDANPPTSGRSEGTWLTNFTFPPNSTTPLYIDFGGTTTTVQAAFGVAPSDLNGTWFEISCDRPGGGGGGGGSGETGLIHLAEQNTPAPTPTRGPSNTPRPTFTPSRTFTPGPPTNTPRPQPTATVGPTNTPRPSPTFSIPTPTPGGSAGGDKP